MRILFLWAVLLSLISFAVFYIGIRPAIINDVKSSLTTIGYNVENIGKVRTTLSGITLKNIALDKDGFNMIETINIDVVWHRFLGQPIQSIAVNNVQYSSIFSANLIRNFFQKSEKLKSWLIEQQTHNITVENITWDISSSLGAIRLTGNIHHSYQDGAAVIEVNINTAQNPLSFTSQIKAKLADQTEQWNISISDGKANTRLFSIARANGWFDYSNDNENHIFTGQIDAGSGTLFSAPLNNIQLIVAKEKDQLHIPVIIRAQLTGVENSTLTSDIQISPDIENQDIQLNLITTRAQDIIQYLTMNEFLSDDRSYFKDEDDPFVLEIKHMKERRFEGGPYPFSFSLSSTTEQAEGTFIFYPDDATLRGSASGNKNLLRLTNDILVKEKLDTDSNTIRFEKNILLFDPRIN